MNMSLEFIRCIKPRLPRTTYCTQACVAVSCRFTNDRAAPGELKAVPQNRSMAPNDVGTSSSEDLIMANNNSTTSKRKMDMWASGLVLPADDAHVKDAAAALKHSQIIAVPTDTLYGFACDACSEPAIQKIYSIKGRSATRPLAICVADVQDIELYGTVTHLPKGLLGSLLPGPVTLILPRGESSLLDQSLNPGLQSIGVRIPDDLFIRSLCRDFGGALALTSANLSNQPSTVSVEEFKHLWAHCRFVFDGGRLPSGRAGSTIIDLTLSGIFKVVRNGSALQETKEVLTLFGLSERAEERSSTV